MGGCQSRTMERTTLSQQPAARRWLKPLNALAFVVVMVVNKLGGPGPVSVREFSATHPSPITPVGWTFAIWGVIYLFQALLWLVYQWLPFANASLVLDRIAFWHVAICCTNVLWIVITSYGLAWPSTLVLWVQLVMQVIVYVRIHTLDKLDARPVREQRTWFEWVFVCVPWALYTSWVLGASLISIFPPLGMEPADVVTAGLVCLAVAAFCNIGVLAWTRDVAFAAVNVWTFLGIYKAKMDSLVLLAGASAGLGLTVAMFTLLTWVAILVGLFYSAKARAAADHEPLLPSAA